MEGKVFLCKYLIWVMLLFGQLHGYKSCVEKEREALLELKQYMISVEKFDDYVYATWTNDTKSDCCRWKGVKCNRTSGRVTEIAVGTLDLKENSLLNLSLLHPFEEVQSFVLSSKVFETGAFVGLFDDVEGYKSLSRLRNLKILDFSSNSFDNSIFPFLNAATSLTTLNLRGNTMAGSFPAKELKDLTNLTLLDLSVNKFNGSIPVRELSALRKLKALDLSDNEFSGSIELQGICELKNMHELDLSNNNLVGHFPICLTQLSGLRVLDLSSNQLTGKLPGLPRLESLVYLSLFDNDFEGFFSLGSLANLSKLKVVKLCSTSKSLQVESESSWKPKFQLSVISLSSCNLEKVPHFLLHQKDLRQVDLSNNNISGTFPSWMLANNSELQVLLLQSNSFTSFHLPEESAHNLLSLDISDNEFNHLLPENIGWMLPQLMYMSISNNGFQGHLPSSLGNMKMIKFLDMSHNSFHGTLPESFLKGCYSMKVLKLSHNKLSGEALPESANFTRIRGLSMDNNLFSGKIGKGLRNLTHLSLLDISTNNLSGVIPSWIAELPSLFALLVSHNMLEGEIPISLFRIDSLRILDLSENSLSGNIPTQVKSPNPAVLLLNNNNLSGAIPDILLENVEILNLRYNRLSGNIPEFINSQNISVLLLRGNNLTGGIPHQVCGLSNIRLLDLANNRLNGSIPSCLSNTAFGLGKENAFYYYDDYALATGVGLSNDDDYYHDDDDIQLKDLLQLNSIYVDYGEAIRTKIEFATKHRYDTYMGGNLQLLLGIDLSENELSGEIPLELGALVELQALNLSHNRLSGVIPESFSGLKNVESLDLSFNRLQGQIPSRLAELSSLEIFNVSFNNLSGVIPQGRQFNTFDTQSYLGNPLLCGQAINKSCQSNNNFQEPDNDGVETADESPIDMVSFYWSAAAAYVTILVGLFASLSFDSPWSRFWFYMVEVFIHKARGLLW